MNKKLRYACIGAGRIADRKHLVGYANLDEVEMVAVCDFNEETTKSMAQKYNIPKVYTDYKEMLNKEQLDIVSVCTPNYLHEPVTLAALEKGIHVHCEKPIALNAVQAQAMVDVKNKSGCKLMVALNNRFTNHAFFVKKYIEEGYLGEIYHAKCGWRRRRGIPGKGGWFTNKELSGGGPLIDLGVHFMDLALYFMGYVKPVSVVGATYAKFFDNNSRNGGSYGVQAGGICDVEDFTVGLVRLENDATVDFEFSWASNIEENCQYYELLGTKGGVCYKNGELKIFSESIDTCMVIKPDINYSKEAINEFEHFVKCILEGKEPIAAPEEAVELMKIIGGVYRSSEIKKEIAL